MSVSEEFWEAFPRSGHIVVTCGLCGRTHFSTSPNAGTWDDGELEGLIAKAAASPDRYIGHDCVDSVMAMSIGAGTPAVWDCPCGGLARYEAWVWAQRESIIAYLTARSAKDKARAAKNADALAALRGT